MAAKGNFSKLVEIGENLKNWFVSNAGAHMQSDHLKIDQSCFIECRTL